MSYSMPMSYGVRHERLEDLEFKSEKLEAASKHFYKKAKGSSGPGIATKIASAFTGLFAKKEVKKERMAEAMMDDCDEYCEAVE